MRTQQITLIAAGVVALLVLAALAAFALLPGGGSSAGDLHPFVIVDGRRLDPPYEVTRDGADVLVNGEKAQSLAPTENTSSVGAPAAGDDVFTIVEQAARASDDAGGGSAGLTAALALLASHPAKPAYDQAADPQRIEVTDAAGETASLQYEVPDTLARPVTDGGEGAAAEMEAEWEEHLADGGGIVASTTGAVLLVPAVEVEAFEAALADALALSGAQKDAALADLLGVPALIEEQGGTPPGLDSLVARLAPDATRPVAGTAPSAADGDIRGHLAAGSAKTPGKAQAYTFVFTRLSDADRVPFVRALQGEHYRVLRIANSRNLLDFTSTSRTGALYNVTHSSPRGLSVAVFDSNDDAAAYSRQLHGADFPRDAYYWWREGDNGPWWLALTPAGISAYWQSNDSIVHSASCNGARLAPAFGAREFFGYAIVTSCAIALPDSTKLWDRWSGKEGNGEFRSAALAWARGGFHEGFRWVDGSRDSDTVLSPAVPVADLPDVYVGGQAAILIGFDALMDTAVTPNEVIAITGCAVIQADSQWQFDSLIVTQVTAEQAGEYQVTVRQANAKSKAPARIALDGNQTPQASGVVPSQDDHIAKGRCLAGEPTPTSGVDPRTPTPTATEITTGGGGTTGGPTVEVVVLVINGEHFPAEQFIGAPADACSGTHYHARQPVRSLEGGVIEYDPNPSACGFGLVSEIPTLTVQWPKAEVEAWEVWARPN